MCPTFFVISYSNILELNILSFENFVIIYILCKYIIFYALNRKYLFIAYFVHACIYIYSIYASGFPLNTLLNNFNLRNNP